MQTILKTKVPQRNFDLSNALQRTARARGISQLRLAAEIIKALDRQGLSVRAAQARTKVAAADFSRIRSAELGRFTVDRLMSIVNRLGSRIDVRVRFKRDHAA